MGGKRRFIRCDQTGQEFTSVKEASRLLDLPYNSLWQHLNGTGNSHSVRGYTFTEISATSNPVIAPVVMRIPASGTTKSQAILCNETKQVFCSINDAAKKLGISRGNLSEYLNHKQRRTHVGGYTFIRVTLEFDFYIEPTANGEDK